ncbi:hypothetical protein FOA43_004562 [Brettanomyces nanus]|uniref:Uncharacterized protein n=1 Tax=Eeniella nana TaxID=13502 RepID=A0A875RY33_EENNA|nr:uncharacterized protein FOA43_004562 [Brettanomyces nanus]QPG77157.1 hypothetical protein FOA43_004562 [Brettanomyces nanus]
MSLFVTLILIALVTFIICLPYIKANLADISPSFLERQSSVGPTRKQGESTAYRSVDVPHGLPLTGGLRIRIGYKLRDGCLKDIWSIALKGTSDTPDSSTASTLIQFDNGVQLSIGRINHLIHIISSKLEKLTQSDKIGIFSDYLSPQSVLLTLSCFFVSEKTLVNFNSLPKQPVEDLDLIIVDKAHYQKVLSLGFSKVIVIGDVEDPNVVSFDESIVPIETSIKSSSDYSYKPNEEYMDFNNQPYTEINDFREVHFFQRSFVSAIGARLLSLPTDFSWSESDSLLIGVSSMIDPCSKNALITNLLCGLLSRVSKITIRSEDKLQSVDQYVSDATILAISDQTLNRIVSSTSVSLFKKFEINRAEYFNSLGFFTTIGKISPGLHLKLVYSLQTNRLITSRQYNTLRSSLGARIIREKYSHVVVGPVLKTNIFEHRVLSHEKFNGFSISQLGVSSNALELKLKKKSDDDNTGELYARGYSVGKGEEGIDYDAEFWVDLGIRGKFAKDGCFYEYK